MTSTVVQTFGSDTLAQKKWSAALAVDDQKKSYFSRKFVGTSADNIIQRKTELESEPGDVISFDLSVQLRGAPVTGDFKVKGTEENLRFFSDTVKIDQVRKGVSAGGKMTRKRTAHNLRQVARDRLGDFWSAWQDELTFMYLAGKRGVNADFIEALTYTGHAGNSFDAPDTAHIVYGGSATAYNNIASTDKMAKITVEKAIVKADTMRQQDVTKQNMLPVMVMGEPHYVLLMHNFQEYDMRTADTTGWIDIQKAAAGAEGRKNRIFTGGLGMINNAVLHKHVNVVRSTDAGAGANVAVARALLLARQAGVVAWGIPAGAQRFTWTEELEDAGNEPMVYAGTIVGMKKTRFNSADYGVISVDTAAAAP